MQNQYTVHPYYPEIRIPSFEEWKDINGYKGCYQISNRGRVKSLTRIARIGNGRLRKVHEKILKPGRIGKKIKSHLVVNLSKEGQTKMNQVHRLVLETFVGKCPSGLQGNHKDDNPNNNHINNLYWGTQKQNADDAEVNGGRDQVRGENHYLCCSSEKEVLEVRRLYATENYSKVELANMFNKKPLWVHKIVNRLRWKHI